MSTNGDMKAAVLDNDGLHIERITIPEPKHGEVLIEVTGCGVCHSDLHVVRGGIPVTKPLVPGHEAAGIIVEHGPGVPTGTPPVGSRVVSSFVMPCGKCRECDRGRDDLCINFFKMNRTDGTLYDGTSRLHRTDGEMLHMFSMSSMAQYAVVPALAVFHLPESMPSIESALLGCATLTAYSAIKNSAGAIQGKSVAVVASGGVGLNIIQLCRIMGAEQIIAVDISDEKLRTARDAGASDGVNGAVHDAVEAVFDLTEGIGVDVAFEALGTSGTFMQAFNMVRNGGKMVPVGLNPADISLPVNRMVRSQVAVHGSYGARSRVDMPDLLGVLDSAGFNPMDLVSRTAPLEELPDIFDQLEAGRVRGRAVLDLSL